MTTPQSIAWIAILAAFATLGLYLTLHHSRRYYAAKTSDTTNVVRADTSAEHFIYVNRKM